MDGLDGRWWGTDEVPVQSDRGGGLGTLGSRCSVDAGCRAVYYRALQGFAGLYRALQGFTGAASPKTTPLLLVKNWVLHTHTLYVR